MIKGRLFGLYIIVENFNARRIIMAKKGKIKISSENMMPIIKKWLYSDKDIFLREIVANGIDAMTKHKKLDDMGEP